MRSARKVGVVFDARHQESYMVAKGLINELNQAGKQASGIGAVNSAESLRYFPAHKHIVFFPLTGANLLYWPVNNAHVREFLKEPYDLLIDLSYEPLLQLRYITAHTKALTRVGMAPTGSPFFDIALAPRKTYKQEDVPDILADIKHYLDILRVSDSKFAS